jgi:type VI secretion system protein ImpE
MKATAASAQELLAAGSLARAIQQLGQELKSHPSDLQKRTFLFELLCFSGDYERAERQLDVVGHQNTASELGVHFYRSVLAGEKARRQVFAGEAAPAFVLEPPTYIHRYLEAIHRLGAQQPAQARALLEEAEQQRPACSGRLDGTPFEDFRDADDLVAACLEQIANGQYAWLPFEQIRRVAITPPKRLRDLLWIPATVDSERGPSLEVLLPVLYAGSSNDPSELVQLGRATEWRAEADGPTLGVGQRLFAINGDDRPILDVREIEFDAPAGEA